MQIKATDRLWRQRNETLAPDDAAPTDSEARSILFNQPERGK
jgi:hypothetical protein